MTKEEFVNAITAKRSAMTKMDTKCMKDFSRHQKDTDMMDEYLLVEEVEMGESYSELSADGDRE